MVEAELGLKGGKEGFISGPWEEWVYNKRLQIHYIQAQRFKRDIF